MYIVHLCRLKWIILYALVMNFVFCVAIFYIHGYSTLENYKISDHKYDDGPTNPRLKIKNTVIPTANLKLNVFDKMLSEEMLSIKQHFHNRDSSHTPSVRISVQGLGPTPTLEVKQKWPIENLFMKSRKKNNSQVLLNDEMKQIPQNLTTKVISTYISKEHSCKNDCGNEIKDKVLELRSLPETRAMRICDCMKTNTESTCSHRCTGMDAKKTNNICKHTTNEVKHECTRSAATVSPLLTYSVYPIYVTYPSYFWGVSTFTENPYYHPNPMNEIKISKTKRRGKIKKPHPQIEDSYQQAFQSHERYDNSMENYIDSIENYDEDINNFSKHKSSPTDNIAIKEYVDDKDKERLSNKLEFVNKDSFVNEIVEDLKEYYSDVVIKDCYCSLSSRKSIFNACLISSFVISYSLVVYSI